VRQFPGLLELLWHTRSVWYCTWQDWTCVGGGGQLALNSCGPTNEEHYMEALARDARRVSTVEEDSPDSRYMQSSNYPHSQARQ